MKASNSKPKRQAKNAKKPQHTVQDLIAKKDVRGGENISLNYTGMKHDYHQQ